MKNKKLYRFSQLEGFLDKKNIPRSEDYHSNVVIDRVDLTEQEQQGNIEWREDGVYLNIKGNYHRGFMYIKRPDIGRYGKPKFHILECKTILDQKSRGWFNGHYFWSNSAEVTLTDRQTNREHENEILDLCYNCRELIYNITKEDINTTEDFHNLLEINNEIMTSSDEDTEIDINGYTFNWRKISRAYRETKNYICEKCGFGGGDLVNNYDKRYLHIDHKDGNKKNNHTSNLQCLCILCHSRKDERHTENFEKRRMQKELNSFIVKYGERLQELGNPYLLISTNS